VGAGPAGCAAAIELCVRGAEVTLISDGGHGVGEQLDPAARPLLERLGLLPLPALRCVALVGAVSVDFLAHPLGCGWLLDRKLFGTYLRRQAVAAGARLLEPCRLLSLEPAGRLVTDRECVECDFAVDASGRRCALARRWGARRTILRRQTALVGSLLGPLGDVDETLCVEALGSQWAYTCRTGEGRRVAAVLGQGLPRWGSFGPILAERLRGYTPEGKLRTCRADTGMLDRVGGERWVAVGDAAATFDPVSSQGLFWAFRSGIAAAEVAFGVRSVDEYAAQLRSLLQRSLSDF
jgi:flavin-dependent dehydrogenase